MSGFERLRRTTPARLDVGRAGSRPRTATLLDFRGDHAAARDAVWSEWPPAFLAHLEQLGFLVVSSAAGDRHTYVLNPPLGRRLAAGEAERIRSANAATQDAFPPTLSGPGPAVVQLVLSDGLSAVAGERHGDAVVPRLLEALSRLARLAVPVAVRNGRVAIGDEIAQLVQAAVVVHLIGERPGLATAESLSAYIIWRPRLSSLEPDRTVISNIHSRGLRLPDAARKIADVMDGAVLHRATGAALAAALGASTR
jgi:ethanolamine ammonia-lyase small subunit